MSAIRLALRLAIAVAAASAGLAHAACSGLLYLSFDTGNMRYKKRERYVFGYSNFRGVYGTPGA